jgi:hypothetical protein
MDRRLKGPYVAVEDLMRRKLKLTLMHGMEELAAPIEVPERSKFFALCCSNPNVQEVAFNKFEESAPSEEFRYCLVVYDEARAIKWFEDALVLAAQ